jgi:ATP-binding cassette, subfamily B (MDR/TAP), member 1
MVIAIAIAMFYEWRLGLVALSFTPFTLAAAILHGKISQSEILSSAQALEKSTKVNIEFVISNYRLKKNPST